MKNLLDRIQITDGLVRLAKTETQLTTFSFPQKPTLQLLYLSNMYPLLSSREEERSSLIIFLMYSIESAGVRVTLRPLPLLSDARELQRTGGVMLDVRGQRPDIFVSVVISIASIGALEHCIDNAVYTELM